MTTTGNPPRGIGRRTILAAVPAMAAALAIGSAPAAVAPAAAAVAVKRPECLADLVSMPSTGGDR